MFHTYDKWPEIAHYSYFETDNQIDFSDIDHIVFAGMGGSGILGDVLSAIISKSDIHVKVVKGYLLPNTVDSKTLVVTTSISGNTKETMTILKNAAKTTCKLIAFSAGGEMQKFCSTHRIKHYSSSYHNSPRASFTSFLYSMLKTIGPIIKIKDSDVNESIHALEKQRKKISYENLSDSNPAIELSKWITDIPIIYYPAGLYAAAFRFKNCIQENAKMHAMIENVIEASHNNVVAWERPSKIKPILLQGKDDYIKTKERWKIFKKYFQENAIEYKEIMSPNGSILTKLSSMIYFLDFVSIYVAVNNKLDPSPVNSIKYLKRYIK